jgi:hypothetical protein
LSQSIENDESRPVSALSQGLIDLGRLPERIRKIAGFWGGSTTGSQALYELAQTNGFTRDVDALRSEIYKVHDRRVREEFLVWLAGRAH